MVLTYTDVSYTTFAGKSDYSASTIPTSTAMTAFITRAYRHVQRIAPSADSSDVEDAVLEMCVNWHNTCNMEYRTGGAGSLDNLNYTGAYMGRFLSWETLGKLKKSRQSSNPADSITVGSFRV